MRETLEMRLLVAISNNLDSLVLILRVTGLQAVINGNETDADETGLETERKGNGEKSTLFSLKDRAILYNLLNLLWLLHMMTLI